MRDTRPGASVVNGQGGVLSCPDTIGFLPLDVMVYLVHDISPVVFES